MTFTPLFTTTYTAKPSMPSAFFHKLIRDQFTIQTWLAFGAAAQCLLFLLPIRAIYAMAPAYILLLVKTLDTALITFNLKPNTYIAGVLDTKFTALIPNLDGTFGKKENQPSPDKVTLLLLGFRVNHPLGPLAPGAQEMVEFFRTMAKDLEAGAPDNGFLGSTTYLNASSNRATKSGIMVTFYFRSLKDSDAFAHSPVHRKGWMWWSKVRKQYKHIAINHEVYEAPKGKFECVYDNSEPSGFAATSYQITDEKGEKKWISPVVDAMNGQLANGSGRWKAYD